MCLLCMFSTGLPVAPFTNMEWILSQHGEVIANSSTADIRRSTVDDWE